MTRPRCILCGEAPARRIVAQTRGGHEYLHATAEPVFCTLRCAGAWALLHLDAVYDGGPAYCAAHGWHPGWEQCSGCRPDERERELP